MRFYSRIEIVELLEVDAGFVDALEREEIIFCDASSGAAGAFSERMLERVRVAYNLVHDLDVNLAGVAIIIQMREDMSSLRHQIEGLLNELKGSSTDR
jgi:MerR family transcriptional regulator/heat shock protein HspR